MDTRSIVSLGWEKGVLVNSCWLKQVCGNGPGSCPFLQNSPSPINRISSKSTYSLPNTQAGKAVHV